MVQVSLYCADSSSHKLGILYRIAILHDEPLQVPVFLKNNITRVKSGSYPSVFLGLGVPSDELQCEIRSKR